MFALISGCFENNIFDLAVIFDVRMTVPISRDLFTIRLAMIVYLLDICRFIYCGVYYVSFGVRL